MNLNNIHENFPFYPNFREGQEWALDQIANAFNNGKRFVILEAPTGSGKSALATALARCAESTFIITIQKFLQDQYMRDFGDLMIDLKGRNAYDCVLEPGAACDRGPCKTKLARSFCPECMPDGWDGWRAKGTTICPYWERLYAALNHDIVLLNFHSYLYQTCITKRFGPRELLIIDEAHNTESCLLNFVSFRISDLRFQRFKIRFKECESTGEYLDYFEEIGLEELILDQIKQARYEGDPRAENEWTSQLLKYEMLRRSARNGEWIVQFKAMKGYGLIELKPIFVDFHAGYYLFSKVDKVFMMSATILNPDIVCQSLGIKRDEVYAFQMKNRFPVKNRPIYYRPSGSLSYRNKQQTYPKLVTDINKICRQYEGQRGIIHTHNFEIAEVLLRECAADVSNRFLFQKNFRDKHDMLEEHKSRDDAILVAPAMHEGLDLVDDLGRFQIICKVPYPSFKDNPQLEVRKELSPAYYNWVTAIKLVQSAGRVNRHENDKADTYILDEDFGRFRQYAKKMLPGWFKEAIISKLQ